MDVNRDDRSCLFLVSVVLCSFSSEISLSLPSPHVPGTWKTLTHLTSPLCPDCTCCISGRTTSPGSTQESRHSPLCPWTPPSCVGSCPWVRGLQHGSPLLRGLPRLLTQRLSLPSILSQPAESVLLFMLSKMGLIPCVI